MDSSSFFTKSAAGDGHRDRQRCAVLCYGAVQCAVQERLDFANLFDGEGDQR